MLLAKGLEMDLVIPDRPVYAARQLATGDLQQVVRIERASMPSECTLTRDEMRRIFDSGKVYGYAADHLGRSLNNSVAGFVLCARSSGDVCILRIGVLPEDRRNRVGWMLIDSVKQRATDDEAKRITITVPESCLDAQLFLRRQGFWAIGMNRDFYQGIEENGIEFEYLVAK